MKNRSQNTCDDTSTSVGSYPGIYDIQAPVMSMSRFKIGHLERLKRLYGYLLKTKQQFLSKAQFILVL